MSTPLNISRPTNVRRSKFQSAADWILDVDGDMYGDERERLRWYEGIAISASVQWILIPWMLAVMAWICSTETAPYLWVVWVVTTIPQYVTLAYVTRTRVNVYDFTWTRKRIIVTALIWVPLAIFLAGMTVGLDLRSNNEIPREALIGGFTGACFGGLVAWVFVRSRKRRAASDLAAAREADESAE